MKNFKVIAKSNFDNEMINDVLICENIEETWADEVVKAMNHYYSDNHEYFFKKVPLDYKLYEFEP